jgi:hypothetical protein
VRWIDAAPGNPRAPKVGFEHAQVPLPDVDSESPEVVVGLLILSEKRGEAAPALPYVAGPTGRH